MGVETQMPSSAGKSHSNRVPNNVEAAFAGSQVLTVNCAVMLIDVPLAAASNWISKLRGILNTLVPYLAYLSAAISLIALRVTLRDRRPKLVVRIRKGRWITWKGQMLVGIVEVYNASSRPNTISAYRLSAKGRDGKWVELESERYEEPDETLVYNDTPLIIGPYSGAPVQIAALGPWKEFRRDLQIKLSIEDLFGKRYSEEFSVVNRLCPA